MRELTSHARSACWLEIISYAPIPCQYEPPPHAAEYGGNPERKTPFPFSKRIPPAKQKCMERFSFGVLPSKYSGSADGGNAMRFDSEKGGLQALKSTYM